MSILSTHVQAAPITAEVLDSDKDIYVSNQKQSKEMLGEGIKLFGENKVTVPEKATVLLKLSNYIELSATNAHFILNRLSFDKKFIIFPDSGIYVVRIQQTPKNLRNLNSTVQFKISNIIITVTNGIIALEYQANKLRFVSVNSNSSYSIIGTGDSVSTNKVESLTWVEFDPVKSEKTNEGVMNSLADSKNKLTGMNLSAKQISFFDSWTEPNTTPSQNKTQKNTTSTTGTTVTTWQTVPQTGTATVQQPTYVCITNKTNLPLSSSILKCTNIICNTEIKDDISGCSKKHPDSLKGYTINTLGNPMCIEINNQNLCYKLNLKENIINLIELGAVKFDTSDSVMININGIFSAVKPEILLPKGTYTFRFKKTVKDPETGEEGSLIKEKRIEIESGKLQTISN